MQAWVQLRMSFRRLGRTLRRLVTDRSSLPADLEEELRSHVELLTEANLESGMGPEKARMTALRRFGWRESIEQQCRMQRTIRWLEDSIQDIRFAARQLRKSPGFTAAAVVTLALGIGANTAVFSIICGVLLKPLPYPAPDQLVTLWERNPRLGMEQERVSGPNYLDWRAQSSSFAEMAVSPGWEGSQRFNVVLRESTTKVQGSYVSASLFTTLGTQPLLGRTLLAEEDRRGGDRVAVLGYELWRRLFSADTNVIGRTLSVDSYGRRDYTIVGVMPPGFGLPGRCELWLPLGWMGVDLTERRSAHWHNVIGRLKPGVTLAQARTELSTIQSRINHNYPGESIGSEAVVITLLNQAVGSGLRTALLVLWGVVASVLLIACANVASLLLGRAAARQKEFALRSALGAGRGRLLRQLLVESLLLAMTAGACGVALGWAAVRFFVATAPGNIPRLEDVTLDGGALAFTLGISALAGVLFGLGPALPFLRPHLADALKESPHGSSAGTAAGRARSLLIVTEVALSVALLASAGLMLTSFARMLRAERGFQPQHLLTAELDFSVSGFTTWVRPTATRPQVKLQALLERVRAWPGVQAAGAGSRLLRRENNPPQQGIAIFGQPARGPDEQPKADFQGVTPDWFRALGGRLLRGRDVSEADSLEAPGVVLINETTARRFFPGQDPIGQRMRMGDSRPPLGATNIWGIPEWSTIIGVVGDLKSLHPQPEATPEVYVPYWQWPMQNPTVLIRATGQPVSLIEALRRETHAQIPELPAPVIRTMTDLLSETVAQPRLEAQLVGVFAGLALLLAAVGLYGVVAYMVTQRTREIAIRMALGAVKRDVVALVIRQGMKPVVMGVAGGLAIAWAASRLMSALLYAVEPGDPLTLAAASLLLIAVALLACWLPARRAARIEPLEALRSE